MFSMSRKQVFLNPLFRWILSFRSLIHRDFRYKFICMIALVIEMPFGCLHFCFSITEFVLSCNYVEKTAAEKKENILNFKAACERLRRPKLAYVLVYLTSFFKCMFCLTLNKNTIMTEF